MILQGKATNHIWFMEDGEEPHVIGVRLDCGDSGVVYFTREQAADLSKGLSNFLAEAALRAETPTQVTQEQVLEACKLAKVRLDWGDCRELTYFLNCQLRAETSPKTSEAHKLQEAKKKWFEQLDPVDLQRLNEMPTTFALEAFRDGFEAAARAETPTLKAIECPKCGPGCYEAAGRAETLAPREELSKLAPSQMPTCYVCYHGVAPSQQKCPDIPTCPIGTAGSPEQAK